MWRHPVRAKRHERIGQPRVDVKESRVRYLQVTTEVEALEALKGVDADPCTIRESLPKMIHANIILEQIDSSVANIIKQQMRNVGRDAAFALDEVDCGIPHRDVILMGTLTQIRSFTEKITVHPLGLCE